MSIRFKILALLIIAVVLYGGIDLLVQMAVIRPSFLVLEHQDAEQDMDRCVKALFREIHHLEKFCYDWSAWDDAYAFIQDGNIQFAASNLVDTTYTQNDLNLIYFVGLDGKVVWGHCLDLETRKPLDLAEFPAGKWAPDHPLLAHHSPESIIKGMVATSMGAVMVASCPIVKSDRTGPVLGSLIMGRFLNDDLVRLLSEQTQVPMRIQAFPAASPAPAGDPGPPPPTDYAYDLADPSVLGVSVRINDIQGHPLLQLRANVPRFIAKQAEQATRLDTLVPLMAGLIILLITVRVMGHTVLEPLHRLTRHVTDIGKSGALTPTDMTSRADEFGLLAAQFNRMIERLRRDNEERERAETALRASEAQLRAILQAAPDAVITASGEGVIESFNPAAQRIFGRGEAEAIGRPLTDLVAPDQSDEARGLLGKLAESTGQQTKLEATGVRADGSAFPVHAALGRARIGDRDLVIGVFRDITDLRKLHEKVMQTRHLAKLGEMGAAVAHEIRNPITGISALLQNLHKELPEDDPHREAMEEALRQIGRMNDTVQQMLTYARPWQLNRQSRDLRVLLEEQCAAFQTACSDAGHAIAVDPGPPIPAAIDPVLFEQLIQNLLQNAVEAMAKPGRIDVTLQASPEAIRVCMADTGCGLDPAHAEALFEPFFTTKTRGTGLGLAICRRIMEAHGGSIAITGQPGQGAQVTIEFPA
jgi:two-component system sensor kinase FixL